MRLVFLVVLLAGGTAAAEPCAPKGKALFGNDRPVFTERLCSGGSLDVASAKNVELLVSLLTAEPPHGAK